MKTYLISALIALVVALGVGMFFMGSDTSNDLSEPQVASVGAPTNADALEAESLAIGNNCDNAELTCAGTTVTKMLTGTCNATGASAGIAATSTSIYFCSVTGVTSGDKVFVSLPEGANVDASKAGGEEGFAEGGLLSIGAAFATTTNIIGFEIINLGPATTTFRNATTSIQYWVLDS